MRSVFGVVLLVAAVGLSLYNTMELRKLRGEVSLMRARESARAGTASSKEARIRELRRKAEEHLTRAHDLLRRGEVDAANKEMEQSKSLLTEAARAAGAGDLVAQIRETTGSLRKTASETAHRLGGLLDRARGKAAPDAGKPAQER